MVWRGTPGLATKSMPNLQNLSQLLTIPTMHPRQPMGFSTRHIHNTEATMTETPDPGLTDLIAAHYRTITTAVIYRDDESDGAHRKGFECVCACGDEYMASTRAGDRTEATVLRRADSAHVALVVEQHTNGRIAELEAELEKYHAEERRELEWDRFCAQQDVRCTECGLRYGERKDYTCPHIGEHKYDADELRAALEGEQQ